MHFHTFAPHFLLHILLTTSTSPSPAKNSTLQESVALDAMSGDANALKIGQTLADKFRQAGDKKDL